MVIILTKQKSSKKSTNNLCKEPTLDRLFREEKEKKSVTLQKEKDIKQSIENENKRLDKLIIPHLQNITKQLVAGHLLSFWAFPDRTNFKKIVNTSYKDMEKKISKDIKKYQGRIICDFTIVSYEDKPKSNIRKAGIWLQVSIVVYHIDNEGKLAGKHKPWGCDLAWSYDDFKFTTLTFKLLKRVMTIVAIDRTIAPVSLLGFSIKYVVNKMEQLGYDLSDVLEPLRGANIKEKK